MGHVKKCAGGGHVDVTTGSGSLLRKKDRLSTPINAKARRPQYLIEGALSGHGWTFCKIGGIEGITWERLGLRRSGSNPIPQHVGLAQRGHD
jgi:hypothetical protein